MKKYDIIVAGGGFAGTAAAIAAARRNMSVLLIEQTGCLGGAASNNLVVPFMRYFIDIFKPDGTKVNDNIVRGIFLEIINKLKELGAGDNQNFNTEYLKVVLDRMLIESGADVLFHSTVTGVHKKDRKITSVDFYSVSGMMNAEADFFIDATGDANLSALAGCEFKLGRDTDSLCQPMTLCFRVSGVNYKAAMAILPEIQALYKKFREENKIKNPREDVLIFPAWTDNVIHFNSTRIVKLNPTDTFDLSRAELLAREQMLELIAFLKSNFELFKNADIVSSAPSIGVRESRMIIGEHYLTAEELIGTVKFSDAIAAGNYNVDIHNPEGSGTIHHFIPMGEFYTIPYRSLIAKNFDNLLVAGRCISCDHVAQSAIRIMPLCAAMGEAAGAGASISVKRKEKAADTDISEIQASLKENGAFIGI